MKPFPLLLIALLSLTLCGCSPRKIQLADYSAVRAGMTYDEVRIALSSRPAEIWKGGTVLVFSENTPEYEQFARLGTPATKMACISFLNRVIDDSMHWKVPAVRGVGPLVYTTWVMPHAPQKTETLSVAIPVIRPDTVYRPAFRRYFISFNDGKTWQEESESKYDADRGRKEYGTYGRSVRLKEVDDPAHYAMVVNEGKVSVGIAYYEVESQYCIVFDSSTGRVVEHRFLPRTVRKME